MYTTHFDANNKVWSGPKSTFEVDRFRNFGEILLENLSGADSERVAQIDGDTGETLTKTEIRNRTIRCAQNLTTLGCKRNDCIAVVARNHHNLTPLLIGSLCIGAPFTALDVVTVTDGISLILKRLRPTFIFCDADVLEAVRKTSNDIELSAKLFTVNGSIDGVDSIDILIKETGKENSFVCTKIEDSLSQIAVIACSSGSTGLPKSICMTHAMFAYTFIGRTDEFAFRNLNFSSLYWFTGVWSSISSVFKNTRVFTKEPFSTDLFFDLVSKYKVQFFLGPPCQLQAVVKSDRCQNVDLSSLIVCFAVGGFIPSVLVQSMKEMLPKCMLLSTYGMTEIGGSASCSAPKELEDHPNSAGRLVPGVEVKIINVQTGQKCDINEEGEIHIKVPIPPLGYYKDEEATRNSFDSEEFFISGDLGYFDETGRLFIIGRKKEIFKNCGFAIWPAELEDLILKNPAIKEASVVNVYDDDLMSDLPAVVVVKKEGASITEQEVYDIIAGQLAQYKRLDGGVYFVNDLPMTPSGKIVRAKVKEMAQRYFQLKKKK